MNISIKNLVKKYGAQRAVDNISLDVAEGEFVSLLGPSGCGKTTTLRCLAGLEVPEGGSIAIGDQVMCDPSQGVLAPIHARNIGMVFQSYAVWPHMTVARNVGFPLSVRGVRAADIESQVSKALGLVGLNELKDRYPSQLSGGQQQRVALARAVIGKPRVLLFDEPLSNLDAKLREGTRAEIRALQRRLGVAALYVTHDQEEALAMSDRVIVMNEGKIAQAGPPMELYHEPKSRFVANFVGKASFLPIERTDDAHRWRTQDGSIVMVDHANLEGTHAVQLMLRPENVALFPGGNPGPAEGRRNALPGRVIERSYMGPHTEYLVAVCGSTLKANSQLDIPPDAEVTVQFEPDRCRAVYDMG